MRVTDPVKVNPEDAVSTEELIQKIAYANNTNSDMAIKALKDITFTDNFKNSIKSLSITNNESTTVKHSLKTRPSVVLVLSGRADVLFQESSTANTVNIKVILKSSYLKADVSASTDITVLNPNIFLEGDSLIINDTQCTISSIADDGTITLKETITATALDRVQIYEEDIKLLIN